MSTQITDTQGRLMVLTRDTLVEPEPGSVVLIGGENGNAWQRYARDGVWHRGKYTMTWDEIITERNVLLVHDAPRLPCPCDDRDGTYCLTHGERVGA